LGASVELERELAFRWVLATRSSPRMVHRYLKFQSKYAARPTERRTVRNWLLRSLRKEKYVYRAGTLAPRQVTNQSGAEHNCYFEID
jgi:hypothetical protein